MHSHTCPRHTLEAGSGRAIATRVAGAIAWVVATCVAAIAVQTEAAAASVVFTLADARDGKPIADAVVSLVPLDGPAPASAAAAPVSIEQKKQEFVPFVTAVRKGTTISLPNRDTVEHHAYSQSPARPFDLPLYKPGRAEALAFDKPGVVAIGCNIHDWMLAYVVVLDTPWFAVSPETGTATLRDIPAGRYRAEIWHPRLDKAVTQEITVGTEDLPLKQRLTLKPDRRVRRAPGSAKGGYR